MSHEQNFATQQVNDDLLGIEIRRGLANYFLATNDRVRGSKPAKNSIDDSAAATEFLKRYFAALWGVRLEHVIEGFPGSSPKPSERPGDTFPRLVFTPVSLTGAQLAGPDNRTILADGIQREMDRLGDRYCEAYRSHFMVIGVAPEGVADYFVCERQTLAALYTEVQKPRPSRSHLRRSAYRLALDARRPIPGELGGYFCRRDRGVWKVSAPADLVGAEVVLPENGQLLVPISNPVLDCVEGTTPDVERLAEFLDALFGGPPPEPDPPCVSYSLSGGRFRVYVGDREVKLKQGTEVEKHLRYLCENPGTQLTQEVLRERRTAIVSNVSRTLKVIRKRLGEAHEGAGGWLESSPVRWVDGRAPVRIDRSPGKK